MKRGSRRAKTRLANETFRLRYQKRGSKLWGKIQFYRATQDTGQNDLYRESHPFVIADYTQGVDRPIVYGSLVFLLSEMKRLMDQFKGTNAAWWRERRQPASQSNSGQLDLQYDRQVMDFTILLATYARNLFDLLRSLDTRTIPKLNHEDEPDGKIRLRELFDTLIHNRYYHFDGTRIRNVFTSDPPPKRSLATRFMGYAFDLDAFANALWEIIHEIQLKDLTQIIRQRFKRLSSDSKPHHIVFLVQNIESMSHLLKAKIHSTEFASMRHLLFTTAGIHADGLPMKFQPPTVRIAPDITQRRFDIHFRYGPASDTAAPDDNTIRRHHLEIGYIEFLTHINSAFGDHYLLSDFTRPQRLQPAPTR